ncbi:MAG TPA: GIY-YIG nuclease family protein [Candidatus Didemnitutus sp.]|nr:GIY-YIG nuclease family protein [Candidatus Didemnitutus sp.]
MPWFVYILRDAAGRHYIGMTSDLDRRIAQHRSGGTQTTRRMQGSLSLAAAASFATRSDALLIEHKLKNWKNPHKAIAYLSSASSG